MTIPQVRKLSLKKLIHLSGPELEETEFKSSDTEPSIPAIDLSKTI